MTRYQEWHSEIVLKEFKNEKQILKYIRDHSEEEWYEIAEFCERAYAVFGESSVEDEMFYGNSIGQFISPIGNRLYGIPFDEFLDKINLCDSDSAPVLVDFFKPHYVDSKRISLLLSDALRSFSISQMNSFEDVKFLNKSIEDETNSKVKPSFFTEKGLAYLIVIIGELLRKTTLKSAQWNVQKKTIEVEAEDLIMIDVYAPCLVDGNGEIYDLIDSLRQNLLLVSGSRKNAITKVLNKIIGK